MNTSKLIDAVSQHPAIVAALIDTNAELRRDIVKGAVELVASDISVAHDWDFNTDYIDMTSVADQSFYKCAGNKNDCRDIITVSYGEDSDSLIPLYEYSQRDRDDYVADVGTTSVELWAMGKRDLDDFPRFELVSAPDTAGYTIRVRYRMKGVDVNAFPDNFEPVLFWGVMASLLPEYTSKYTDRLGMMKRRHDGAGKVNRRVAIAQEIQDNNKRISSLTGSAY